MSELFTNEIYVKVRPVGTLTD